MASRAPPFNQPPSQHPSIRRNLFPQATSSNPSSTSTAQPYTRPTSQSSSSSHAPSRTASASYTSIPTSRRAAAKGSHPPSTQNNGVAGASRAGTATDGSGVHSRPAISHNSSLGDEIPSAEAENAVSVDETPEREDSDDSDDDIIVRDQDGGFKVEPLAGLKMEQCEGESDEDEERGARFKPSLIELYRNHRQQHIDPAEWKAAVQANLRLQVASLDDDKWMYEPDLEPDPQT
ncbi:MAG: hypothetical protein M1831_002018 [Alyxoria varia]|nr:MAG: hypothetical protein M1831_002018 [Alyxoria varia]